MFKIVEVETPTSKSWCNTNDDKKKFIRNEFRILASFDKNEKPRYFIYLNETGTVYKTGDFYLTIQYSPTGSANLNISDYSKNHNEKLLNMASYRKKRSTDTSHSHSQNSKSKSFNWDSETNQLISDDDINKIKTQNKTIMSLHDVTEFIFDKNSTDVFTQLYLTVCERSPKIRVSCINHETVRVRLCEVDYQEKNRSYCLKLIN